MTTTRHRWTAVVALAAVAVLAGCASKVDGSGAFAAGSGSRAAAPSPASPGPTGGRPTEMPTGPPSGPPTGPPTELPTELPTNSPTGPGSGGRPTVDQPTSGGPTSSPSAVTGDVGQAVCDAVSDEKLQAIFKQPATAVDDPPNGCRFASEDYYVPIAVYKDFGDGKFTVAGQKAEDGGGNDLTIAGHPACLTKDNNLVVSRTDSPSAGGIVKAYGISNSEEGHIATQLMALVVPHFVMT